MLHEHTGKQPLIAARLFLTFGVTTIRTAGTEQPYADLNLERRIGAGQAPGPELHLTGPFLSGEGGFLQDKVVRDAEDAR